MEPRFDLIPPEALVQIATVLAEGGVKHGDRTWEEDGRKFTFEVNKALKHILAWCEGKTVDPDSGQSPLSHAIARLSFVVAHTVRGTPNLDNRSEYARVVGAQLSLELGC